MPIGSVADHERMGERFDYFDRETPMRHVRAWFALSMLVSTSTWAASTDPNLKAACRGECRGDFVAPFDEVEAIDRLVVRAHAVVALGAARVVVERDAWAHDVDEGRALVADGGLDERHELALVALEAARHEARAHQQRERGGVDRQIGRAHV